MTKSVDTDRTVREVLAMIQQKDWDALKPLLHPYLHWTLTDGRVLRGRTKVLDYLASDAVTGPPRRHELRDSQIYRWIEAESR